PHLPAVLVVRFRPARVPAPHHRRPDHPRARARPTAGAAREQAGDGARVTAFLDVADVVRTFGAVRAVDGASFAVDERSITGLIGPNGAGESTLFATTVGWPKPDSGRIVFSCPGNHLRPALEH